MDEFQKLARLYIVYLRAIAFIHKQNHWITFGIAFYGNHLLFDRIYTTVTENLDSAVEKLITLFGDEVLNYDIQVELLNEILNKYNNLEGSPLEMSLNIEKDFLNFSKEIYDKLKEKNKLTLGLDDLLMSIANERETSIYLLNRALKK